MQISLVYGGFAWAHVVQAACFEPALQSAYFVEEMVEAQKRERAGQNISPRDYTQQITAWYFGREW